MHIFLKIMKILFQNRPLYAFWDIKCQPHFKSLREIQMTRYLINPHTFFKDFMKLV